jgi:hypothetical protein
MDGAGILSRGDIEPAFFADFRQGDKILRRPDRLLQEFWGRRPAGLREYNRLGAVKGQFMSTMSGIPAPIACRAANTAGVVVSCSLIAV